jgi:hypothetical protein
MRKPRKPHPSSKPQKEARKRSKPVAKRSNILRPAPKKKPSAKKSANAKPKIATKIRPLDLSSFPAESITVLERWICLACVWDVFTRHLKLAPRTARIEIKRYTPSISELSAPSVTRPWFSRSTENSCPYCGSSSKRLARVDVYRLQGGKETDGLRRKFLKSLPQSDNQFVVLEEKDTRQHAFYEWLEKISTSLDLDNPVWLREVSRLYLMRKQPGTDWQAQFSGIHSIRRSRRLEEGWEVEKGRLFLAPMLFDELLLVQYLVSRSHKAGGQTLEGRYTLPELFSRLRRSGYLRAIDIQVQNPADVLEQLVTYIGGGDAPIKFYYLVDRRNFLEKQKNL